jgi:hypothetical protein
MKKMHEIPFVAFLLAIKQTFPSTFLEQKYSLAHFCKDLSVASLTQELFGTCTKN